jgi:hypothetical protein
MTVRFVMWAVAAGGALYGLHQLGLWAEARGWIYYHHKRASSSTLTNAVLEVQSLFDAGQKHALEIRRAEDIEDAESGDPPH